MHTNSSYTHTHTHTHLLLVAYPVRRLQALLQEGEAQLVYGRFVEVILHKAVTGTEESSAGISYVTINLFEFGQTFQMNNQDWWPLMTYWSTVYHYIIFKPVLLDNIHKVSIAPLPEVFGAKRDECRVVHAHSSSTPRLLLLLLQHLTQWRLAVLQGFQLRVEQAVQSLGAAPCRHRCGAL